MTVVAPPVDTIMVCTVAHTRTWPNSPLMHTSSFNGPTYIVVKSTFLFG